MGWPSWIYIYIYIYIIYGERKRGRGLAPNPCTVRGCSVFCMVKELLYILAILSGIIHSTLCVINIMVNISLINVANTCSVVKTKYAKAVMASIDSYSATCDINYKKEERLKESRHSYKYAKAKKSTSSWLCLGTEKIVFSKENIGNK